MNAVRCPDIIVVRHGESDANQKGIISDRSVDHELTGAGVRQAKAVSVVLITESIEVIITSTRQRARLTAEIINQNHKVPIVESVDLIERGFGVISGLSLEVAQKMMEEQVFNWVDIPESETTEEIDVRVKRVMGMLEMRYPNRNILISTHADIVKSFYRVLNGVSVENSMSIEIKNSEPHYFHINSVKSQ